MRAGRLTEGRTDMTNLIASFRNFSNAPKLQFVPNREEVPLLLNKDASVNDSEGRMNIIYGIFMYHINTTVSKNA